MKKKEMNEQLNIEIAFDLNPLARIIAVKDFLIWADEEDLNVSHVCTLLRYERFLKGEKNEY